MRAFGRALLTEWALDPAITYLNHGTVGAPPRRVLAAQQAIRDSIERQPARYLLRELADVRQFEMRERPRMRVAADAVAEFLGARGDDLAFTDNATTGANAVLRSLRLGAGDEIVVTDHGYGAVAIAAGFVAGRAGGRVVTVELPHPRWEAAAIVEAIVAAVTPRTKLVIIDHVTSPTALVLPVAELVARCHAAGAPVLVDGAHAPGALAFDLPSLGADWYTGNLHKWAMAPRSSAILWAPAERRGDLHPTVISWGFELGFDAEFDLVGTRDPSPWLAAPEGLAFMRDLGLEAMRAWNHALAWDSACMLARRWDVELPQDESLVGAMVAVPLPARFGTTAAEAQRLKDALLYEDGIEAQIHEFRDRILWRISAQVYNDAADVERATRAIEKRAG
jgi:isopenicillin-N epimerase